MVADIVIDVTPKKNWPGNPIKNLSTDHLKIQFRIQTPETQNSPAKTRGVR